MLETVRTLSGELVTELAANSNASAVDPTKIPLRSSTLKLMARSAAHAHHSLMNDWEPTLAMRLGSGCHSLLLGGPAVVEWKGKQRRGKDFDAWRKEQPVDAIVLLTKDYKRAHEIAAAVRADAVASRVLFADGMVYEKTILWEQDGRARRSTPDARNKSILVDLKTCRSAEPEKFRWDAIRMGYHCQLADYAEAFEVETGHPPRDVYIVAVEQRAPYGISVHRLTVGALERGAKLVRTWLDQFRQCEASGIWPSYSETVLDFEVPLEESDLVFADDDDAATDNDE